MSPVEICGMPYFAVRNWAWVPFPAPGRPSRSMRMTGRCRDGAARGSTFYRWCRRTLKRRSITVFRRSRNPPAPREELPDALEVRGRVDSGVRCRARDGDADAIAVRERSQLLERFERFDRRGLESPECVQKRSAICINH